MRLANSSCHVGNLLNCQKLIGGYFQETPRSIHYEIQLLCSPIGKPHQRMLSSVTLQRESHPPQVKKVRRRILDSQFVFIISVDLEDQNLMTFLLMLRDIIDSETQKFVVYVMLDQAKLSSKHLWKHPQETDYSTLDLKEWYRSKNIKLQTYKLKEYANTSIAYHTIFMDIQENHRESNVLISRVDVKFDETFLLRCRALSKKGRHIYRPFPGKNIFPRYTGDIYKNQEGFSIMWMDSQRPVCIHANDLHHLLDSPSLQEQYEGARIPGAFSLIDPDVKYPRKRKLKIISAYDTNLQVD